jgi:hypothetical protein
MQHQIYFTNLADFEITSGSLFITGFRTVRVFH